MPSGRYLLLRAKPFNNADLIIDALSKEGEKLVLTAKNATNSRRRFSGGVLEPLNFVEIYYTQAKSGYHYIQEARIVYGFAGLRENYRKLELSFHFLKLISKATYEGLADNSQLFDLLGNALRALETTEKEDLLKLQFELKYLFYLGFLEPDDDTSEFVAKPISLHNQIELTEDESLYLSQLAKRRLRDTQIEVHQEGVLF